MRSFWPGPLTLILRAAQRHGRGGRRRTGLDRLALPGPPGGARAAAGLRRAERRRCPGWRRPAPTSSAASVPPPPNTCAPSSATTCWCSTAARAGSASNRPSSTAPAAAPCCCAPACSRAEQIEAACGQPLRSPEELPDPAPRASGTLAAHYAPNAPVRLMDAQALQTALDLLGPDAAGIAIYSRAIMQTRSGQVLATAHARRRGRNRAPALCRAARVRCAGRAADLGGDAARPDPEWDGVRDRLQRASAA